MNCNDKFRKSTLNAYSLAEQTIAENGLAAFENFQKTGCAIDFAGGTSIRIDKQGLYQIIFTGSAAAAEGSGNVSFQLIRNGTPVLGAIAEAASSSETDIANLAFTAIVEILPSCNCASNEAVLVVQNTGEEALLTNAAVSVIKLC